MLKRKKPLSRNARLKTTKPMRRVSEEKLKQRMTEGDMRNSTFKRSRKLSVSSSPKRRNTGPKQSVTDLVKKRSGGICEWRGCFSEAIHRHHRLNRKNGGRHGEMHERINEAHWILHACLVHHAYVTSAFGERRKNAIKAGWVLTEGQDAAHVEVHTRHFDEPVFLLPNGKWLTYEEACA